MPGTLTRRPHHAGARRGASVTTVGFLLALALAGCSVGAGDAGPSSRVSASAPAASTTSSPAASPTLTSLPTRRDVEAVTALLRSRAQAVVSGDEQAYAGSLADRSSAQGRRELASFAAARALRVSRLAVGDITVEPSATGRAATTPRGGTSVRVRAAFSYRVADLDRADRTTSVLVDLRRGPGGWAVVSQTADAAGAPPWVVMPGLRVRRGEHAVVAGTAAAPRLAEHVRVVDRAVPGLRRDWARTPRQVLVLAPATVDEADALLGRATGSSSGSGAAAVAATTEGPTGTDGRATGDRVVLDPTADARLTPAGRDVVLTHELTHVAVRATVAGRAAGWLAEGYADHVGYRRADVSERRLLEPLLAEVRAGRAPAGLPRLGDLDPGSGSIEVPYLAAWQAVELLARQHGEGALRRLVVAGSATGAEADAEAATDAALRSELGTTRAQLTERWLARLDGLARNPS